MWIYLNENGNVTTMIPHGQPVRQGNRLDIWIARPYGCKDWTPMLSFLVPGSNRFQSGGTISIPEYQDEYVFHKLSSSETTYDLKEGMRYSVRRVIITGEPPVATAVHGNVKMSISIIENGVMTRQATCDFDVERTYGTHHEQPVPTTEVETFRKMVADYYEDVAALIREIQPGSGGSSETTSSSGLSLDYGNPRFKEEYADYPERSTYIDVDNESGTYGMLFEVMRRGEWMPRFTFTAKKDLYVHHITICNDVITCTMSVIHSSDQEFTYSALCAYMSMIGLIDSTRACNASGTMKNSGGNIKSTYGLFALGGSIYALCTNSTTTGLSTESRAIPNSGLVDVVERIG